jgi:hypothetical protein
MLDNENLFRDIGLDSPVSAPKPDPAAQARVKDLLPPDILYRLENSNDIAEWNMEDIETLAGIVNGLRKKGREELQTKQEARKKIIEDTRRKFEAVIAKQPGKNTKGKLPGSDEEAGESKRSKLREVKYGQMNDRRFFRMLDGGKDGIFYEVVHQGEDKAYNESTRHETERKEKVDAELKAAGIDPKDLWRNTFTIKADGFQDTVFTLDEMLFFHRAALNDRAYAAVVFGIFSSPGEKAEMKNASPFRAAQLEQLAVDRYGAAMNQLEDFLAKSPNGKFRQVEAVIGGDYDNNYSRIKEFVAREYNQDMGSEENYIPLSRTDITGDPMEQETVRDVLSAAGVWQSTDKGFTLSRVDIPPWAQTPVRTGLYKTWDSMVTKQEYLMAYAPWLRQMRQIFGGPDSGKLRSDIKAGYSQAANKYIEKYFADLANPETMKSYSDLDTLTRLIRGHYPAAVLSWRISSIIKQAITSPPPFFQYMNPAEYAAAAAECLRKETRDMILEKSMHMKTRVYEPALAMIKQLERMYLAGSTGKAEAVLAQIEKAGMTGLEWIDHVCVYPGWWGAYKKKLSQLTRENKLSPELIEAEAVRFADQVVRDTQPSNRKADLAPLLRNRSPVAQIFLQFQVPLSVIFQNLVFDMPNAVKNGNIFQALTTVGIYAVTAAVVGILTEDDDEDKFDPAVMGINAAAGLIESIPVIGGGMAFSFESFLRDGKMRTSQRDFFPIGTSAVKAVNAVSERQWWTALSKATDGLFFMTGLPQGLKREAEKAAEEGDWTVFLGYR